MCSVLNLPVVGDDTYGRKVIVISACNLPPREDVDHLRLLGYDNFIILPHKLSAFIRPTFSEFFSIIVSSCIFSP